MPVSANQSLGHLGEETYDKLDLIIMKHFVIWYQNGHAILMSMYGLRNV